MAAAPRKFAINTLIGRNFISGACSIVETEKGIPDSLAKVLEERCPGFLDAERALSPKARKTRPLALRLEDWIEDHVFGLAKKKGKYVLRSTRPALSASRSVLVGVHREVEAGQTDPVSVVRGVERHGGAV